jgi:serine/threonine protein kinase
MDQYEIERILARGTFGTVYLCHLKKDLRKQVVIKKLAMEVFNNSDKISALNETKVLSMLNHPNIIKYYDTFLSSDATSMYIVMEYAPGGTLFDLIEQRRKLMALLKAGGNNAPNSGYFQGLNYHRNKID